MADIEKEGQTYKHGRKAWPSCISFKDGETISKTDLFKTFINVLAVVGEHSYIHHFFIIFFILLLFYNFSVISEWMFKFLTWW